MVLVVVVIVAVVTVVVVVVHSVTAVLRGGFSFPLPRLLHRTAHGFLVGERALVPVAAVPVVALLCRSQLNSTLGNTHLSARRRRHTFHALRAYTRVHTNTHAYSRVRAHPCPASLSLLSCLEDLTTTTTTTRTIGTRKQRNACLGLARTINSDSNSTI